MNKTYDAIYQTKRCEREDALISHLIGKVRSARTLDIACGTGHFHDKMYGEIVGLDKDPEMLSECKSDAMLYQGSFTDYPAQIKNTTFELVTNLFGVFGGWHDFTRMLQEASFVLPAGGGLFLVAYGEGRKDTEFAKEGMRWGDYIEFTPLTLRHALKTYGYDTEYCFGMSATFLDWFPSMFNIYHALKLPDRMHSKNFRAHYVVTLARKQ